MSHIVENQAEIEQQLVQVKLKISRLGKVRTTINDNRNKINSLKKIEIQENNWKDKTLNDKRVILDSIQDKKEQYYNDTSDIDSRIQNKINELESKKKELEASLGK